MDGGKLLGTGSSSCVFSPDLTCKGDKNHKADSKRVSKLLYHHKSKELLLEEKKINVKIKQIKNHNKWSLTFYKYCKPPPLDDLYKLDKEGFDACLKKSSLSDTYHERIDDVTNLTSGLTGGITLEDYFIDNFYNNFSFSVFSSVFRESGNLVWEIWCFDI